MEKLHQAKGACLRSFSSSHSGQSSMEYLLIVALTFAIIVPTSYLFYNYSRESGEELTDAQITQLGRGIIDAAESIFYSGEGSKTVLELNVPKDVASAQIIDYRELVFNITSGAGVSEVVFFSSVNISTTSSNCEESVCKLTELASPGLKKVKIEAISNSAEITVI